MQRLNTYEKLRISSISANAANSGTKTRPKQKPFYYFFNHETDNRMLSNQQLVIH